MAAKKRSSARRGSTRSRRSKPGTKRRRPARLAKRLHGWLRACAQLPATAQILGIVLLVCGLWLGVNWIYQVVRKPTELLFPVSERLYKSPEETWRAYAPLFHRHSTAVMTPELLAALAQVEASGNPIARTYWRFRPAAQPFDIYRPASSAVGMYQLTDGTFEEARRYCIHDHVVVEAGRWSDPRACWFNALYTRVLPSHAIELASAYLDRQVTRILRRHDLASATLAQRQDLAAIVHLCGAGAGNHHARRGLHVPAGQRCGDHDVRAYLRRVNGMKRVFARLASGS